MAQVQIYDNVNPWLRHHESGLLGAAWIESASTLVEFRAYIVDGTGYVLASDTDTNVIGFSYLQVRNHVPPDPEPEEAASYTNHIRLRARGSAGLAMLESVDAASAGDIANLADDGKVQSGSGTVRIGVYLKDVAADGIARIVVD